MDRDVIRKAYARSIMLGIRAGGHAVNIGSDAGCMQYETISWQAFAVSKALRAVQAELGIPAPVTLAEIEACAAVPDVMCGSDGVLIDSDLAQAQRLTGEAVLMALGELVDHEHLLEMVAAFPVAEMIEETSWAA